MSPDAVWWRRPLSGEALVTLLWTSSAVKDFVVMVWHTHRPQMPGGSRKFRKICLLCGNEALEMTYLGQRKEPVFRMLFFFLMIHPMWDLYEMNCGGKKKARTDKYSSFVGINSISV